MNDLAVRQTIPQIYDMKNRVLKAYGEINRFIKEIDEDLKGVNAYNFYRIDRNSHHDDIKNVDQRCWRYLVALFNLERYMLCSEYSKMMDQIEDYDFPVFTEENAWAWLAALESLVYTSVQKLIEDVFERVTTETYWTGSGYSSRKKKKRNNNGIDKHFILSTGDASALSWYSRGPTITDDLEKACFIIDGKTVPEITIKATMKKEKIWESENSYFRIRVCQNGNTHYWIKDEMREKLNFYGSKKGVLGSSIKIKIFDR